jgi:iron complex outermembrane recepter protein
LAHYTLDKYTYTGSKMAAHCARRVIEIGTALTTVIVAAAPISAASAIQAIEESDDIIVRGYPPPDIRFSDVPQLDQLTERDIAAYGVDTVSELVAELAGELASTPLVLVNGRKVSSLSEVADLPTESIRRVEVLPEQIALRYGGDSGQRVINFVLRPQFRSATANLAGGLATEGGGRDGSGAFVLTRIAGDNRLSLGARAYAAGALLESERDIRQTPTANPADARDTGRFRTLLPELRRYSLNGTIARKLSESTTVSLTAKADHETSRSLHGLPTGDSSVDASVPGDPLEQRRREVGGYGGLTLNADLGRWWLSMTGDYDHRLTRTRTDRDVDTGPLPVSFVGDRLRDLARSRTDHGGVRLVALGSLFKVPAGDVRVSLRTELTRSYLSARRARSGLVETGELDRTDAGGWLNIEVPITRRSQTGTDGLGDLSGHVNAGIRSVSDLRTLHSLGYGLNWSPRAGISLTASIKEERRPPGLVQLADPIVETSGIRSFDYVSGETVELTRVSGGNPALLADQRRTFKLGVNLLPFGAGRLRISADYLRIRTDNPIAVLTAATAAIEAAFPDRFVRDADGTLVRVDNRPLNVAREDHQQLRWGFIFRHEPKWQGPARETSATGGDQPEHSDNGMSDGGNDAGPGLGLRLSLHHRWVFKDEILLRPGAPTLDLLRGGAVANNGGRPRHELQWELGANRRGLGARLIGNWRSGTVVREGSLATDRLRFSPLMQLDLRLFADVGDRFPTAAWARGFRVSLTIANLLNDRQRVRDASGTTPLSYQPAHLDPLGRRVSLGIRKLLF